MSERLVDFIVLSLSWILSTISFLWLFLSGLEVHDVERNTNLSKLSFKILSSKTLLSSRTLKRFKYASQYTIQDVIKDAKSLSDASTPLMHTKQRYLQRWTNDMMKRNWWFHGLLCFDFGLSESRMERMHALRDAYNLSLG